MTDTQAAGTVYLLFRTQDDDDPFIKGEFDVIKELLEKIPEAKDGKQKVSRIPDPLFKIQRWNS